MKALLLRLFLVLLWAGALLLGARQVLLVGQLWLLWSVLPLLFVPLLLSALHTDTVRLIHRSTRYQRRGWLHALATSRILSTLFWTSWALLFSLLTVFWLAQLSGAEQLLLLVAAVLLVLVHGFALPLMRREMAPFAVHATAVSMSRWLMAALLTAALWLLSLSGATDTADCSLSQRVEALSGTAMDSGRSHFIQWTQTLLSHLALYRTAMADCLPGPIWFSSLLSLLLLFALTYNFSLLLSVVLLPLTEYRRVFSPIDTRAEPPAVGPGRALFSSLLFTLLLFLLLPLLASLEQHLRLQEQRLQTARSGLEAQSLQLAEMIDGVPHRLGTAERVTRLALDHAADRAEALLMLQTQVDLFFDSLRSNVDVYLDHYYSLPGEYLRIAALASGRLEERIQRDVEQHLLNVDAARALESTVAGLLDQDQQRAAAYRSELQSLLAQSQLDVPAEELRVLREFSLQTLLSPPDEAVFLSLEQRLGVSGAGVLGTAIMASISSKVAAKGGFKLAASALIKASAGKVIGGAGGAGAGALIGSVVPGAGTLIGGGIGFGLGIVFGLSIDAVLLRVEEAYSREEFRQTILAAIDEQQAEFNARLTVP